MPRAKLDEEEGLINSSWGSDRKFEPSLRRLMRDAVQTGGGVCSVHEMVEHIVELLLVLGGMLKATPGIWVLETR